MKRITELLWNRRILLILILILLLAALRVGVLVRDSQRYTFSHTPFMYPIGVYLSYLDPISDYGQIPEYYVQQAAAKKDLKICDERFSSGADQRYFLRCYWFARDANDLSTCAFFRDRERDLGQTAGGIYSADSCYRGIASARGDFSICDSVSEGGREYCIDDTWQWIAIRASNEALCNNVKAEPLKNYCHEAIQKGYWKQ